MEARPQHRREVVFVPGGELLDEADHDATDHGPRDRIQPPQDDSGESDQGDAAKRRIKGNLIDRQEDATNGLLSPPQFPTPAHRRGEC